MKEFGRRIGAVIGLGRHHQLHSASETLAQRYLALESGPPEHLTGEQLAAKVKRIRSLPVSH